MHCYPSFSKLLVQSHSSYANSSYYFKIQSITKYFMPQKLLVVKGSRDVLGGSGKGVVSLSKSVTGRRWVWCRWSDGMGSRWSQTSISVCVSVGKHFSHWYPDVLHFCGLVEELISLDTHTHTHTHTYTCMNLQKIHPLLPHTLTHTKKTLLQSSKVYMHLAEPGCLCTKPHTHTHIHKPVPVVGPSSLYPVHS